MNCDGTDHDQIYISSEVINSTAWHPDGTKIIFTHGPYNHYDIWTINSDGTNLKNLTNDSWFYCYASWSPDGTQILYARRLSNWSYSVEIWCMDSDANNMRQLTFGGDCGYSCENNAPKWAPDGMKIVYTSGSYGKSIGTDMYPHDIYIMDTNGANTIRITTNPAWEDLPAWSPDGEEIVFVRGYDLWKIKSDGSGEIQLTFTGDCTVGAPDWIAHPPSGGEILHCDKVIIVAGGGPYPGNNLWDATRKCANCAYLALIFQGYHKDAIYYLSPDVDFDVDGNGFLDDVDGDVTNAKLQYAIDTWASDAENLFLYMTDHGSEGTFRMSATELLQATELDIWLDAAQEDVLKNVTLVYDACRSGSFLEHLLPPPQGKRRIIVTSAHANQKALFSSEGTLSFSFLFWGHIINGYSFYDSFVNAKNSISLIYNQNQTPLLDVNGNGICFDDDDKSAARNFHIGKEIISAGDSPYIGAISPAQILGDGTSVVIYAEDVVDTDGIRSVWAVIVPPVYSDNSIDTPVTDLPTINLSLVTGNRYEGTYAGFSVEGIYKITIFAIDTRNTLSFPKYTKVTKSLGTKPLADFICAPSTGKAPLTVHFNDKSIGQINHWLWNFGDNQVSESQHPIHTYDDHGLYTITLTIAGEEGLDTLTKAYYIKVTGPDHYLPPNNSEKRNNKNCFIGIVFYRSWPGLVILMFLSLVSFGLMGWFYLSFFIGQKLNK